MATAVARDILIWYSTCDSHSLILGIVHSGHWVHKDNLLALLGGNASDDSAILVKKNGCDTSKHFLEMFLESCNVLHCLVGLARTTGAEVLGLVTLV